MKKLPLDEWSLTAICSYIRKVVASGDFRLFVGNHALEELEKDGLDRTDIPDVLKSCKVTRKELRGGWRYTCEGRTSDDEPRRVSVVVEIEAWKEGEAEFFVITVWALE